MNRRAFVELGLAGVGAVALPETAWALKYYPNGSEKKWAVLYATWCGSARDAGVWISEGMGGIADVFDVREKPDLRGFDHVIVGSAIRMGRVSPELQSYLEENRSSLKGKVRGLYTVCGNRQRPVSPEVVQSQITDHLAPLCGVRDVPAHVFLGRVTPILLAGNVREMMKPLGEYDNLERPDCMAFGNEVLSRT